MRSLRYPVICLLLSQPTHAVEILPMPAKQLKQQVLHYVQSLRTDHLLRNVQYTWPKSTGNYHLTPQRSALPLMLAKDGAPLGTTAINYKMLVDYRQLGIEIRVDF